MSEGRGNERREIIEKQIVDAMRSEGAGGETLRRLRIEWKIMLENEFGNEPVDQVRRLRHLLAHMYGPEKVLWQR